MQTNTHTSTWVCLLFWYSRVRLGASPWRSCRDFCSAPQTHAYMCAVCKGFFFFFPFCHTLSLVHPAEQLPPGSWASNLLWITSCPSSSPKTDSLYLSLFINYFLLFGKYESVCVGQCVCGADRGSHDAAKWYHTTHHWGQTPLLIFICVHCCRTQTQVSSRSQRLQTCLQNCSNYWQQPPLLVLFVTFCITEPAQTWVPMIWRVYKYTFQRSSCTTHSHRVPWVTPCSKAKLTLYWLPL